MRPSRLLLSAFAFAAAILGTARSATAQVPFQIVVQRVTTQAVNSGGTVNIATDAAGQTLLLAVTIITPGAAARR